ncbi:transducin beta-like protein 3, partial [Leptotrombidium deliense]
PKAEEEENVVNFTANESDVFVAHKNGFIKQWCYIDEETSLKRTWNTSHVGAIAFMTFDSSSTILATGGCDSLVKLWDTQRQYITHYLKGCSGVISHIKFHPKPKQDKPYYLLATGDHDSVVNVYDLKTSKLVKRFEGHSSTVTGIEILINGNEEKAITCSRDKLMMIWCLNTLECIRKFPIFESLESLFILPIGKQFRDETVNDNLVVTAGEKGVLKVWNIENGKLVYEQENSILKASESGDDGQLITQAIYTKETDEIAVVSFENNVLFYNLNDFNLVRQLVGHNDEVLDIKFLGTNENFIVVATNSRHIKIFDLRTLNCSIVEGHTDIVLSIAVIPSNPLMFASSSKDNTLRIWLFDEDSMSVTCCFKGSGHSHSVTSVAAPFKSLDWVVTASEDTTLKVWHIPDFSDDDDVKPLTSKFAVRAHEKNINALAVSPNDKLICSASQDKTAKLWSLDDQLTLVGTLRGHRRGIWCVNFSPVDQVVATSSVDGTIKIWSISDLSCLKTFEGHESSVLKVQFISRGTQLISSSSDGNIKLWRVKTNECTKTIDAHDSKVWSLAVSKDEQTVVTGGGDSKIIFWKDVTIEEQEEAAVKQEQFIEEEQKLLNLIQRKKWTKAIKIAVRLGQPFRAQNILKEIIRDEEYNEENQLKCDVVKQSLEPLREDELLSLVRFAMKWNMNSKHCQIAQRVLRVAFELLGHEKLLSIPDAKEMVESFLPFTERHFNRISNLHQSVTFMQFMWNNMKLSDNVNALRISDS